MRQHLSLGILFSILGLILMTACASAPVGYSRFEGLSVDVRAAQALDPAAYPHADGVVVREYNETRITWLPRIGVETYITRHVVKRIFRDAEDHLTMELNAGKDDEIADLAARVIHPDGTVTDLDQKDIYRRDSVLASYEKDLTYKNIRFNFPRLSDGDVVEYRWTRIDRGIFLADEWWLAYDDMPVLDSEYIVKLPRWLVEGGDGWKFAYKTYNFDRMPEPEIETGATEYDHRSYRWQVKDIPGFVRERYVESEKGQRPHMKFILSYFSTPGGYAAFYYDKTLKEQMESTDKVKAVALGLTAGAKNEMEKIEALRLYVQGLFYSAEHVDYGHGIKPNPPQTVIERGFGDCKDKAILLVVLLRAVGIEADPVLVLTREAGLVDPDFTSNEFNHMIVRAVTSDKKAVWIDGTMQGNTLGWLSWSLAETYGLLVTEKSSTSKMVKLPSFSAADNGLDRTITMELRPDLTARYTVKDVYSGERAWEMKGRVDSLRPDQLVRYLRSQAASSFFMVEPQEIKHSPTDAVGNRFEISFWFEAPSGLERQADGRYIVSLWPFYWSTLAYDTAVLGERERTQPFYTGSPRHVELKADITLPAGAVLVSAPGEYAHSTPGGEMSYRYALAVGADGKVTVTERQEIAKPSIPAASFQAMREFFSLLFRDDQLDRMIIEMPAASAVPAEAVPATPEK